MIFDKKRNGVREVKDKVNLPTGRLHPATAEQVLNHMLPVLAKKKRNVTLEVKYRKAKKPLSS